MKDSNKKEQATSDMESLVFFTTKPDTYEEFSLVLQGSDLYCYRDKSKEKLKFIHSLYGVFLTDDDSDESDFLLPKSMYKIEIKLSQSFKRVFYVSTLKLKQEWMVKLRKATH